MEKELQNTELLKQLNKTLKEVVKFNIRAVTESGSILNLKQIQLNDIAFDIKIVPKNRKVNFNDVPLYKNKREVNMYSLHTGKYIKTFDGTFEAQYYKDFKSFTQNNIINCCNGTKLYVTDYIFLWAEESKQLDLTDDFYLDRFDLTIKQVQEHILDGKKIQKHSSAITKSKQR